MKISFKDAAEKYAFYGMLKEILDDAVRHANVTAGFGFVQTACDYLCDANAALFMIREIQANDESVVPEVYISPDRLMSLMSDKIVEKCDMFETTTGDEAREIYACVLNLYHIYKRYSETMYGYMSPQELKDDLYEQMTGEARK